jgi:predicted kinase
MELVIFIGIQASGKSTFYKERFFHTHVRLNLDMLKTRHREKVLFDACLDTGTSLVVDNTNPEARDRQRYIEPASGMRCRIVGYYFRSQLDECLQRNEQREDWARIPEKGLKSAASRLDQPSWAEGFDDLYYVWINDDGQFVVEDWRDD